MKKFNEFNRALVAKKKIFLFIGAMLLAVTANAGTITQDLDLSALAAGDNAEYNTASHVITPNAAWVGAGHWYGSYDVSDYSQIVIELASACAQPVSLSISYADGSADQQIILAAGATSGTIELNGSSLSNIWVALYSATYDEVTIALSRIYLKGTNGKQSIITLNDTETEIGNWDTGLAVGSSTFADAHAGDQVIINFVTATAAYNQVQVMSNGETLDSYNPNIATVAATVTQVRFTLTTADLTKVQANGIYIGGYYVTIKNVQLRKHAIFYTTLTTLGNWSGGVNVANANLPAMEDGNLLCFHVTAASVDGQVYLQHDWADFTYTTPRNYVFTSEDVAALPKTFSIPVTHALLHQLGSQGLTINGQNFTFDEVFVAEGTPSNTKAAYLNVTAAGMATYVLPFDVPDLPDGVEAYNLTNDGTNEIVAEQVYSLTEDNPVLIIAAEGEYEFVSAEGKSDDVSGKTGTYTNGALVGTYAAINPLAQTTAGNYNYILQKHEDEVAFYQVLDGSCSVAAYHAYLSCGYNANGGGSPAPMRMVFRPKMPTATENTQQAAASVQKVLKDGQLYILRGNTMYTIQGQTVK